MSCAPEVAKVGVFARKPSRGLGQEIHTTGILFGVRRLDAALVTGQKKSGVKPPHSTEEFRIARGIGAVESLHLF